MLSNLPWTMKLMSSRAKDINLERSDSIPGLEKFIFKPQKSSCHMRICIYDTLTLYVHTSQVIIKFLNYSHSNTHKILSLRSVDFLSASRD